MQYLGGKSKIAKDLVSVILAHTPYRFRCIEPFMGGGAMTEALCPHFTVVESSDTHPDLIALWKAVLTGWIPPSEITEEEYKELKKAPVSALRGFAGFAASWGAKWFGGYARTKNRSHPEESKRAILRASAAMENCNVSLADYRDIQIAFGDVVYADPPYQDTTRYKDAFDSVGFFQMAREWKRRGAVVFVSEYAAPSDYLCVWQKTRTRDMKRDFKTSAKVTEKLFMLP